MRGLAALQERVLEAVFKIVPADQVAIVLTENGVEGLTSNLSSIVGKHRRLGPYQPIHVSQTILNRVLKENLAVLLSDVQSDDAYRKAESLLERRVHSVLAVPLEVQGRVLGAMYMEASSPSTRFDSDLLQLFTTLGNITALAIENTRAAPWRGHRSHDSPCTRWSKWHVHPAGYS